MATVDNATVAPDIHGVVQGNGGANDKMAGGAGTDRLEGHAATNSYFGGAGNDTFIISGKFAEESGAHQGASTAFGDQFAYVSDFRGAGGYSSGENDFVALIGWGANSSIDMVKAGTSGNNGAVLYYYTITDGASGHVFNIEVNSLNGQQLSAGDFKFY